MGEEEKKEYRPEDRNLRRQMLLEVKKDVTLLIFTQNINTDPIRIKLKKGIHVTLLDQTPSICATTDRLATGPKVRIDPNQKVEIEEGFLNRAVTIPAQYLKVHQNEL